MSRLIASTVSSISSIETSPTARPGSSPLRILRTYVRGVTRLLGVALLLFGAGACSSPSDTRDGPVHPEGVSPTAVDPAEATTLDGACELMGFEFQSDLPCADAVEKGRSIVKAMDLTDVDAGADLYVITACGSIQGTTQMTGRADDRDLAELLDAAGVCPGDVTKIKVTPAP